MTFATHLIEVMRDDARLQKRARVERIFVALSKVDGGCLSSRHATAECTAALAENAVKLIRRAGAVGIEDNARRKALSQLERIERVPAAATQ